MANVQETGEETEAGYIVDSEGNLVPDYDQTIKVFDDGDIVTGVVVKIDRDEILVDIGYKSEGIIPIYELSIRKNIDPNEAVTLGDEIAALVLQKEDKDGRLILSKKRAEYEQSWIRVEKFSKNSETLTGKVIEVVKGGLILDIGLRGFLPASLVDVRRVKDLQQFVGQDLECKVIEMDRNRNNVVLSRRSVLDEARKQEREKVITGLKKGEKLSGKVSSIVDFGAFVDLGGIDGLIHISEMSWTHIDHPSELLNISDTIDVKVLDIDHERGRISLGLKQCQDDPWKEKTKDLNIGDTIDGRITKIVPFGAFVAIPGGVEGLVHISELSEEHVEVPEEAVKLDESVCAKIVDIDTDRRRVSLSIRQTKDPVVEESDQTPADTAKVVETEAAVATEVEEVSDTATAAPEVKTAVKKKVAKKAPAKKSTAAKKEKQAAASDTSSKKSADKKEKVPEQVLESGDSASTIEALSTSGSIDKKTSEAIDEVLKRDAPTPDDTLSEEDLAVRAAKENEGDTAAAGSYEDVIEQMKDVRGGKDSN